MALDEAVAKRKLTALWKDPKVPVLDTAGKKYVMLSDIHLGDGGSADDFHDNEKALKKALEKYQQEGYNLVLLGDIEEFWQFDQYQINDRYDRSIYKAIRAFGDAHIFRVYGNHDVEWGTLVDQAKNKPIRTAAASEALKLKDKSGRIRIMMVHGHQGSKESDKTSWFSRFAVRLFKSVEPTASALGLYGHTSATKSQIAKDYERILYTWAKKEKVILICGHSHRAIFAATSYLDRLETQMGEIGVQLRDRKHDDAFCKKGLKEMEKLRKKIADEMMKDRDIKKIEPRGNPKPCYFNTGCALFTDGLTAIELDNDELRLVKWNRKTGKKEIFQHDTLSNIVPLVV
jgi:UDP-2,3-diacylglucosamine pyrophosphatase LpxH